MDVQKLFVDMVKEISDRCVENCKVGLPAYKDQILKDTKHELLEQCQKVFVANEYHTAYDPILDSSLVEKYNYELGRFIKGHVSVEGFIQQVVAEKKK
ncbi:MAG: hypothetical protein J6F30_14430 [Cellulosilyticum sp.]|nr:hypothetical protein [Cellulosilyticum sp.]